MNFFSYFSHLLSNLGEIFYDRSVRVAVKHLFLENQCREGHTSLKSVNGMAFICIPCNHVTF